MKDECDLCRGRGHITTAYESYECPDCFGEGYYIPPVERAKIMFGMRAGQDMKAIARKRHQENNPCQWESHKWHEYVDRGDHGTGETYRICEICGAHG